MGKGSGYHEVGALTMATVNEYAGFGNGTEYAMGDNVSDDATFGAKFAYITLSNAKKDPVYAAQARQTSLYLIFTIARSGSGINVERVANNGQDIVVPPYTITRRDPIGTIKVAGWEAAFISAEVVFGVLTLAAAAAYVASVVMSLKEDN